MTKRAKRFTSAILMGTTLLSLVAISDNTVTAEKNSQKYVVCVENEKGKKLVQNRYDVVEEVQDDELTSNNIMVVDMNLSEADNLNHKNNISFVEKDLSFVGSDFEKDQLDDLLGEKIEGKNQMEIKHFLKKLRNDENCEMSPEEQWNIDAVGANKKEYVNAVDKIKVAVLDTGVTATDDIDVAERVNLIEGEEDVDPLYEDVSGHGTSVASVIAAKDNGNGITGINPNVELYSVKVLDDQKHSTLSDIIKGIYWCIDHKIDIINMSFGTNVKSEILEQAIQEADERGILMIAAAGNQGQTKEGQSTVEYPAAYDEVVAVGASNPYGETSEISSTGGEIDVMAPGESVPATGYYNEIIQTDGTSMAAAHVTGVASVVWGKDRSKSNHFVRSLLSSTAKAMDGDTGNGLIDLDYALSIYDEFSDDYQEDAQETEIEKNEETIDTYSEAEVKASWHYNDHASAVGLYDNTTTAALNVIKVGAKISDTASYLKYSEGKTDSFHGHYNYIANYMYVMRMARICYNSGMSKALSDAQYPCKGTGKEQIYNGIKKLNDHWETVLSGFAVNKENKARILAGIATHIVMDTYAHKAYIKDSKGKWTVHISGDSKQDNKSYVSNRWTCAKEAAYDVVNVWHYALEPDAVEFYQGEHSKNKFRLYKFNKYCQLADKVCYSEEKSWFDNRTADEN